MTAAKKIGLFGGSFDPVHLAHRGLAQCALEQLGLDQLRWLPAGRPWQKTGLASPAHPTARLAALLDADRSPDDNRCFVIQAVLLTTIT